MLSAMAGALNGPYCMVDFTFVDGPESTHRRMLRARDAMDRDFELPLRVLSLAAIGCVSEANFIRSFKATFGETPHRYLQRRRIERAMYLLRTTDTSVTDICMATGFSGLGSFMRWLTVCVPGDPSREILLEKPGPPAMDEATAAQVRELVAKGATGGWLCITTDNAQSTYETLRDRGVDITDGPAPRPYGTDFGIRDPFGNAIRIGQMFDAGV
jgi:AraC-like DNA-binding protein